MLLVILISQTFGFFPLSGITSKNPQDINFRWISFRLLFSLLFIIYDAFALKTVASVQFGTGINARNAAGILFFSNSVSINILFLKLASEWKSIMIKWMNFETLFTSDRYKINPKSWSMSKQIKVFTILYLFFALVEHLLSVSTEFQKMLYRMNHCNKTINNHAEYIITNHLSHFFHNVPYNHFYGITLEYFNVSTTMSWNFLDLFIVVISIGISTRYKQLNNRIKQFKGRVRNGQTQVKYLNLIYFYIRLFLITFGMKSEQTMDNLQSF